MKLEISTQSTSIAALEWYSKGYLPCPIVKGQKNPSTNITKWLSSLSEQKIEQHWYDRSDDVALYCSNGLVVLDADTTESKEAIETLEAKHQLFSNLKVETKKGVHHYYRIGIGQKLKQSSNSTERKPKLIDIRSENSYIIAPPSTNKNLLVAEIVPFNQLTELTPEFINDLLMHNGVAPPALKLKFLPTRSTKEVWSPAPEDEKLLAIQALIAELDPDEGYDEWFKVLMAIHHATDGSQEGLAIADEWSSPGAKYEGYKKIAEKWNSFSVRSDSTITMGTVRYMLKERGLDVS